MFHRRSVTRTASIFLLGLAPLKWAYGQSVKLRVGHFPNITHVQAVVAHGLARQGHGWFEERLGVPIDWYVYNAGPSVTEAIFAGSLDLSYVGPSPAINAYVRSAGEEIRVVAGAVNGGAALVVQPDAALSAAADFRGRVVATPQFGNTQDVAARSWLIDGGLRVTLTGGDVKVVPTENPDQLSLFKARKIDAVWTVEPWVTRLEIDAGARVLLEERDAVTTVLVARSGFLAAHRDLVHRFVSAHRELTAWIGANPGKAQAILRAELAAETHTTMSEDMIARAWKRINLTADVSADVLATFVARAQKVGFLRNAPGMARLVEQP